MTVEQKMFDLNFLEQMNDHNFLIQVINLYLDDTPTDLADMQHALKISSAEAISRTAHKLKSSTGMLQASKLFGILEQTEYIAKSGVVSPELNTLVDSAVYEFGVLKIALQTYLANL